MRFVFFLFCFAEEPLDKPVEAFKQPTMNELVQITFNHTLGIKRGYLLVFFGNNVTQLDNPNSDLGLSLQYLTDNIKESNTIILVSGNCIDTPSSNEDLEAGNKNANKVPLFALG